MRLAVKLDLFGGSLILMQQRDGFDERQVLLVIATMTRLGSNESQLRRIRIVDVDGSQHPLSILMQCGGLGQQLALLVAAELIHHEDVGMQRLLSDKTFGAGCW